MTHGTAKGIWSGTRECAPSSPSRQVTLPFLFAVHVYRWPFSVSNVLCVAHGIGISRSDSFSSTLRPGLRTPYGPKTLRPHAREALLYSRPQRHHVHLLNCVSIVYLPLQYVSKLPLVPLRLFEDAPKPHLTAGPANLLECAGLRNPRPEKEDGACTRDGGGCSGWGRRRP